MKVVKAKGTWRAVELPGTFTGDNEFQFLGTIEELDTTPTATKVKKKNAKDKKAQASSHDNDNTSTSTSTANKKKRKSQHNDDDDANATPTAIDNKSSTLKRQHSDNDELTPSTVCMCYFVCYFTISENK